MKSASATRQQRAPNADSRHPSKSVQPATIAFDLPSRSKSSLRTPARNPDQGHQRTDERDASQPNDNHQATRRANASRRREQVTARGDPTLTIRSRDNVDSRQTIRRHRRRTVPQSRPSVQLLRSNTSNKK